MTVGLHKRLSPSSLPIILLSLQGFPCWDTVVGFGVGAPGVSLKCSQKSRTQQLFLQSEGGDGIDGDALSKRNESRMKFGLKPLTEDEFLVLEDQVREMQEVQIMKIEAAKLEREANEARKHEKRRRSEKKSFVENIFGFNYRRTCQSNEDCAEPDVCCDMPFGKVCCYGGETSRLEKLEPALVPVPQSFEWN